ncbi:MAG TPA: hypothetical protein VFF09_04125, partial [archaeon]|nr:hypothetical protein [archaeon]
MSSGKSGAKKLFASALVLLFIASSAFAESQEMQPTIESTTKPIIVPEPIKVSFGETFSLSLFQTALMDDYQITLQDTLAQDIACTEGECIEIAPAPIAVLAVLQKKSDGLEYIVQEKIYLKQGAET